MLRRSLLSLQCSNQYAPVVFALGGLASAYSKLIFPHKQFSTNTRPIFLP